MGYFKTTVSRKLEDRARGKQFHVELVRTPNLTAKKQWVKVTATVKKATFTEKAVIETALYYLPFMEAVQKAQERWPNVPKSYTALPGFRPKEELEKKG